MELTIAGLEKEQQEIIDKYFDKDKRRWKVPTAEEAQKLRARVRELKNQIRFIKEASTLQDPETDQEIRLKLFPLVLRRKLATNKNLHPNQIVVFAAHLPTPTNSEEMVYQDGELFCFEEQKVNEITEELCGCGAIPEDFVPRGSLELHAAEEHLKVCTKINRRKTFEPIARINHVRGNWDCQGCLNTSLEAPADDGESRASKWLEWCPNFPVWARALTPEVAMNEAMRHNEVLKCYGGLMHSQIEMLDREVLGDVAVQHLKVVQMCDTCGHKVEQHKTSEWAATEIEVPAIPAKD